MRTRWMGLVVVVTFLMVATLFIFAPGVELDASFPADEFPAKNPWVGYDLAVALDSFMRILRSPITISLCG